MNIIDDNNMIVWLDESLSDIDDILRPVWIRGISTAGRVDESNCDITTRSKSPEPSNTQLSWERQKQSTCSNRPDSSKTS